MNRSFARTLAPALSPSNAMHGSGAENSIADASAPIGVFAAGAAIGAVAVTWMSQSAITSLKERISATNKKYQTKGT